MTLIQIIGWLDVYTSAARVPFAALTLAVCIFCLARIVLSGDHGPEKGHANVFPWLAAAFVAAAAIRLFLYHHQAGLLNDDYYFAQFARRLIDPAFLPLNNLDVPIGWPVILSLGFWAAGPDQHVMFYMNAILGSLSVMAMFVLVYGVTGKSATGVAAASFLAFYPLHALWSTCGSSTVASVFFMLVSVASLFWFFRLHRVDYMYLSMFSAVFAAQISPENMLLLLFLPAAIFICYRELFVPRIVAKSFAFPVLLLIPEILRGLSRGIGGGGLQSLIHAVAGGILDNLIANITKAAAFDAFSSALLLLAAAGLVVGWKRENRVVAVFTALGIAYFVVASCFARPVMHSDRLFLHTYMMLIVIGSFGIMTLIERLPRHPIPTLTACVIIPAILSFGIHMRNASPGNDYFHYGRSITETIDWMNSGLPSDAILIVEDPAPYQLSGRFRVFTPEMAALNAEGVAGSGETYFMLDISAMSMPPEFCEIFKLHMERPLNVVNDIKPCGLEFGLYAVSGLKAPQLSVQPPAGE